MTKFSFFVRLFLLAGIGSHALADSVTFKYEDAKIDGDPTATATVTQMKAKCTEWCGTLKTTPKGTQRCESCCYGHWNPKKPTEMAVSYDPGPGCKSKKAGE